MSPVLDPVSAGRLGGVVLLHPGGEIVGWHGAGVVVALGDVAAEVLEGGDVWGALDAFGNHGEAQIVSQIDGARWLVLW
jgi:hypothetical protein